jgi:hypothetical protein
MIATLTPRHAADPLALRQRVEKGEVVDHSEGRREGADEIFRTAVVHAVLDAHTRVVLREHGGRDAHEAQAAVDERGRKTDHVEHTAAADGDDVAVAVEVFRADGGHDLPHTVPAVLAFSPPGATNGLRTSSSVARCARK